MSDLSIGELRTYQIQLNTLILFKSSQCLITGYYPVHCGLNIIARRGTLLCIRVLLGQLRLIAFICRRVAYKCAEQAHDLYTIGISILLDEAS